MAQHDYSLIINKKQHPWPQQFITGSQIKILAGSPANWVVNQIVPGKGEDPEIGDDQRVDLDHQAEPRGEKKFTTRTPSTTPGTPAAAQ